MAEAQRNPSTKGKMVITELDEGGSSKMGIVGLSPIASSSGTADKIHGEASTNGLKNPPGETWEKDQLSDLAWEEWVGKVHDKLKAPSWKRRAALAIGPCTIYKVPHNIRRHDAESYQPKVVPIGPYHRGRPELGVTEEHKWRCVRRLLSLSPRRRGAQDPVGNCLKFLRTHEKSARSCYSEDVPMSREEFVEMLLLDGCFIIDVLLKVVENERVIVKVEPREQKSSETSREIRGGTDDEGNRVTEGSQEIVVVGKKGGEENSSPSKLANENMESQGASELEVPETVCEKRDEKLKVAEEAPEGEGSEEPETRKEEKSGVDIAEMGEAEWDEEEEESPVIGMLWKWNLVKLDLLMLENQIPFFIIHELFEEIRTPGMKRISLVKLAFKLFDDLYPQKHPAVSPLRDSDILHLLHLFHSSLIPSPDYKMTRSMPWDPHTLLPSNNTQLWIPSANDLQESAIKFKKKREAISFLEISFCDGVMEIPPLHIYDYSNALFRNLIAFEQCYPGTRGYITAYAVFMGGIMHSERDVRLLHLSKVVVNRLSTPREGTLFFNQISYQVNHASAPNYLSAIYREVDDHHSKPWCKWKAELASQYFRSPWVASSVVGAIILLILNIVQATFSALSYFKQH